MKREGRDLMPGRPGRPPSIPEARHEKFRAVFERVNEQKNVFAALGRRTVGPSYKQLAWAWYGVSNQRVAPGVIARLLRRLGIRKARGWVDKSDRARRGTPKLLQVRARMARQYRLKRWDRELQALSQKMIPEQGQLPDMYELAREQEQERQHAEELWRRAREEREKKDLLDAIRGRKGRGRPRTPTEQASADWDLVMRWLNNGVRLKGTWDAEGEVTWTWTGLDGVT